MAKATRTCEVEFKVRYEQGGVTDEWVTIYLDELKVDNIHNFNSDVEAEKIIKKWKRSKFVMYSKKLKQWFCYNGIAKTEPIEAHHVEEWFTKCEAK